MFYQHRRRFAFALAVCLLFGLLPGTSLAEQMQTEPVADTPAAETVETNVPAVEMPTDTYEVIEAEQVSLSESEVRVIKGGTTILTAEIPEAERGESPLTTSSAIVWTSSNPEVATVDSNGVVTGVDLGEATITAARNGEILESYSVVSTLANGLYVLEPYSSIHTLAASDISMYHGTTLELLPYDHDDLRSIIGDTWYIKSLGAGYYSIHPAFSRGMALGIFGGVALLLRTSSDVNTNYWQWTIESTSNGYILRNRYDNSMTIAPDSSEDYAQIYAESVTTSDYSQRWNISTAFQVGGMLLFDLRTGELVADDFQDDDIEVCSGDVDIYTGKGLSYTLEELSFYAQPLDHSTPSPTVSMSFSSGIASFSSSAQEITGSQTGTTTATISRTISGRSYSVAASLIIEEVVPLTVKYDNAYASRYTDYSSRINQQTQILEERFRTEFDIFLDINAPTSFTSYGDTCNSSGYSSNCTCGETCTNASPTDNELLGYPAYHHKNAYNILVRISHDTSDKVLAYIGHNTCFKNVCHYVNGSSDPNYLYGLSVEAWGVSQVMDHKSLISSTATTVHEFGHLFGAEDHYGISCQDTETINDKYKTNLFDESCTYGEDHLTSHVIENVIICAGCRALINDELPLPES